ncbi:MAG: hypothetical protein ACREOC_12345 [Gemmatimonadales bacterium]
MLRSGQRTEPEPDYDDPGDYQDTGYGSATRVAETACRDQIVRRWRVPESRVRTTGRSTNADGESLVNWEIQDGGAGYCRVDVNGNVSALEVERTRDGRTGDGDFDDDNDDFGSREVRSSQLRACRDEVVRRLDVRPSDVGMNAGELDDRRMAYIEWTLNNGRAGSCLVDDENVVVRFRSR